MDWKTRMYQMSTVHPGHAAPNIGVRLATEGGITDPLAPFSRRMPRPALSWMEFLRRTDPVTPEPLSLIPAPPLYAMMLNDPGTLIAPIWGY